MFLNKPSAITICNQKKVLGVFIYNIVTIVSQRVVGFLPFDSTFASHNFNLVLRDEADTVEHL